MFVSTHEASNCNFGSSLRRKDTIAGTAPASMASCRGAASMRASFLRSSTVSERRVAASVVGAIIIATESAMPVLEAITFGGWFSVSFSASGSCIIRHGISHACLGSDNIWRLVLRVVFRLRVLHHPLLHQLSIAVRFAQLHCFVLSSPASVVVVDDFLERLAASVHPVL